MRLIFTMDERSQQRGTPQSIEKRSVFLERKTELYTLTTKLRKEKQQLNKLTTFPVKYGKQGIQQASEMKAQKALIQSIEREIRSLKSAQRSYQHQVSRINWA